MRTRYLLFSFFAVITLSLAVFAQAGSVQLQTATGTPVSTHASITEAFGAIVTPMTQGYIIELTSAYTAANETFPITLTQKAGIDSSKRITIRPAAGVGLISISALQASLPVIQFDGGDFITIDGRAGGTGSNINLYIENTTVSGANTTTINFINGSTYNELRYLHVKNNLQNSAGPRVIQFSVALNNPEGNSYNKVSNCKIEGSRTGIASSGTASSVNRGLVIENNEIVNWGYAGIWLLSACTDVVISNNIIYMTQGYNNTIVSGITTGAVVDQTLKISGNKIYGLNSISTSSTTIRGISITPGRNSNFQIFNNFIALDQDGPANVSAVYGLLISGSIPITCSVDFNSINISGLHSGGTAGTVVSAAFAKASTNDTSVFKIRNNLFKNTRTGGTAGVFHTGSFINATNGLALVDYNISYCTGSADSYHAGWGTNVYNDIALYKAAAAPNEANTLFKDISYVSPTDLHLTTPSNGDPDMAGIPVDGILTDIDNQVRNVNTPYKGADEASNPVPVELTSLVSSVNGNSVTLKWTTASEKNNNGFQIERKLGAGEWTIAGFVKGKGSTVSVSEYAFIDKELSAGKYFYRLKQTDYDGTVQYHQLSNEVEIGVPAEFSVSQNYPNPFNPTTKIDYSIAQQATVKIELFDMTGSKVIDLINNVAEAGYYSINVDMAKLGLSSGNYIYRLTATGIKDGKVFSSVRKMILMK